MTIVRQVFYYAFATALFLTATGVARATTASEYLQYCEVFERYAVQRGEQLSIPDGGAANCWHFFVAFRELADVINAETRQHDLGLCIPPEVRLTQLIRIFISFARAHPELLHTGPAGVAWQAVWQHFNCNKQQ
jgi:Rap1a immunity proteins